MLTKIYQTIKEYDIVTIFRHARPDGDAYGSAFALKKSLNMTYPNKKIYVLGDVNERFNWMGDIDTVSDTDIKNSLAIILDCAVDYLISDERWKTAKKIIKIDHHTPQGEYGEICYVDTKRESTCGIIADFIFKHRLKMNDEIATLLYTGISTDSGRFRYSQTSQDTFKTVANLYAYNIDTDLIYNKVYVEKLANIKLKAKMIDKFVTLPSGVAYLINYKEDVKALGVETNDLARNMVNVMSNIEEIKVWANFIEDETGEVYAELRGPNVYWVAEHFGGGGHNNAAGMTLSNKTLINDVIKELEKLAKGE